MGTITLLDLTSDSLAFYRLDSDKGSSLAQGRIPLGQGELLPADLSPAVSGDADYYLSIPASLLNFRIMEMPFPDLKKVRELIPFELDGLILGGSGSIVFDVSVLGPGSSGHRVLVAYIARAVLTDILERLRTFSIDPKAIISADLAHAVSSSAGKEIAGLLLEQPQLSDEERVRLCLKEIKAPTFNFRRDEFAYKADDERQQKALRTTAVLALLILIVFLADVTVTMFALNRENRTIRQNIRKTYQSVFPGEKKITDEVYQMKAHLKVLKEKETAFVGISALQTLLDLTRISREGISLNDITIDRDLVVIRGECPSLSDAQKIKTEMETFLGEVNISDTKPSAQNRTQFTISAKGRKI
ncbi:MAG: GspL/Epsl periplasmic domain-containing protein [Thermodesulfovibrionales bacterium]